MFGAIVGVVFGLYVILALVNIAGVIVGAMFSGVTSPFAGGFSAEGMMLGIIIGFVWYYVSGKNRAGKEKKGCEEG